MRGTTTTGDSEGAAAAASASVLEGKRVLITGGSGTLGRALVGQILRRKFGKPAKVTVFSRDEAKQSDMRQTFLGTPLGANGTLYPDSPDILRFQIGDVRDLTCLTQALRDQDLVVHAAAMKQVPTCEYFPGAAAATNIEGAANVVKAIECQRLPVEAVIGISTDKACKPVSVMGMTKAIQERLFVSANLRCGKTRFVCVRYGNVLASRGSVIPLFLRQIQDGGPVTVTDSEMTRFLVTSDQAMGTIMDAFRLCEGGEILVLRAPSCRLRELAECLIGDRRVRVVEIGRRPGEKTHETLVAEDEVSRTRTLDGYYVVLPALPELATGNTGVAALAAEYTSREGLLAREGLRRLLEQNHLLV